MNGLRHRYGRWYGSFHIRGVKWEELLPGAGSAEEAAALRSEILTAVQEGRRQAGSPSRPRAIPPVMVRPNLIRSSVPFTDLLDLYRKVCAPTYRRREWQEWLCAIVEKEFTGVPLAGMTRERVEEWRDRLAQGGASPSTIRKYIYFLSGVFEATGYDAEGRRLNPAGANPTKGVKLPREPKGLRKALTLEQARTVLMAARAEGEWLYRWIFLCLRTGMRVEEAQRLCWGAVELEQRELVVADTKTGEPRRVWVDDELLGRLKEWGRGREPGEPVIGREFAEVPYAQWRRAFATAGVEWAGGKGGFTARNLRTTYVSLAIRNGALPWELAPQTGHSEGTLMAYYAEIAQEQKARAASAMPKLSEEEGS